MKDVNKTRAPGWLSRLSVQLLVSTQVVISQFVGSSPASGSVLTARSLLGIFSPSLCPSPLLSVSLKNKLKKKKKDVDKTVWSQTGEDFVHHPQ